MLTHAKKSPAGAVVFFVIVFVIIIAMARRLAGFGKAGKQCGVYPLNTSAYKRLMYMMQIIRITSPAL